MSYCTHPRLDSTDPRRDYCPDCGYEFYYGDAHATGDAQISRVINQGRDRTAADGWGAAWSLDDEQ